MSAPDANPIYKEMEEYLDELEIIAANEGLLPRDHDRLSLAIRALILTASVSGA